MVVGIGIGVGVGGVGGVVGVVVDVIVVANDNDGNDVLLTRGLRRWL